ncbi:MAG TPA: DUF2505 domain-containing protein [Acidimicrobiia bacterium]|nr:DUF2505 domain-containing protein [Acidimicrobiia bacterium]
MDFDVTHRYSSPPDVTFAMLTSPEFLRARFEATGALQHEIVECAPTSDGGFRVVTKRTVQADIPAFARRIFTPTNSMTQTEVWDPATADARRGEWRIEPEGVPVPVSSAGSITLEPADDGTVQRVVGRIKVSVPLIGGRLERFVFDQAKTTLDDEHAFGERWLQERA